MSLCGKQRRDRELASDGNFSGFAVQPHQIMTVLQPGRSTRALVDEQIESRSYLGRPYSIWRDDPEPACAVNDRRADDARD